MAWLMVQLCVLPLVTLTEIGVIVGLGVLLDTLLVRTLLVPSIAVLLGRRFWWPSALSRRATPPSGAAGPPSAVGDGTSPVASDGGSPPPTGDGEPAATRQ